MDGALPWWSLRSYCQAIVLLRVLWLQSKHRATLSRRACVCLDSRKQTLALHNVQSAARFQAGPGGECFGGVGM